MAIPTVAVVALCLISGIRGNRFGAPDAKDVPSSVDGARDGSSSSSGSSRHPTANGSRGSAPSQLSLHKMFSDSMVLQAEAPKLYGLGPPGRTVRVVIGLNASRASVGVAGADGKWAVLLAAQPPSDPTSRGVSIAISVTDGCSGCNIALSDVLFGDVWVCGGQSNMEFSVAEMFDRDRVIATAGIPGLRLFAVQKNKSTTPLDEPADLQYPQGWVSSSPETVCGAEYDNDGYSPANATPYCGPHCGPSSAVRSFKRATWGYFSAVCFVYGRAVLRDTGRPQGMIESCWGGTSIESWSPAKNGSNFNGMIAPLQKSPIRDQGEANAGRPNPYADQMRGMIESWREGWQNPAPSKNFTFILHQLSACTYGGDVPALRWSQQGAVAPWSTLPNVAMTVGLDLSDPSSPCANVHIRNKTAVGERMALAARAVTYGDTSVTYTGPVATTFTAHPLLNPTSLIVAFSGSTLPLEYRTINQTTSPLDQGVEVLYKGVWSSASAAVVSGSVAQLSVALPGGGLPDGIRYAWQSIPTTQLLFDSTIVSATANLFGLPAAPFWANCSAVGCTLITPGFIPGDPAPNPPTPPAAPMCPQPTALTGKCTYMNHTSFKESAKHMISIPLYSYEACCSACKASATCKTASMRHGPQHVNYMFCEMYSEQVSDLTKVTTTEECPTLALAAIPV